mgnify:CR=1 FL=1
MQHRILLFDIVKAICVIEIVAFWHMLDYTPINPHSLFMGDIITSSVLAAFTFASGFFLGKKKLSIVKFYLFRIKRFLPPLFVSLLIMYIFGAIESFQTVIYSIIGLSCFIPPMPMTLWYFSMLILFYLVTPFLLLGVDKMSDSERVVNILVRGICFYCIIICLDVNYKVQNYFLFYLLGMITDMTCIKSLINMNLLSKGIIGGGIFYYPLLKVVQQ